MADKLLQCPFCGGEAKLVTDFAQTKDPVYCFECEECGVLVYMDDLIDKDKSIEAWNNRPSPWNTGTPTEEGWYLVTSGGNNSASYDIGKWDGESFCYMEYLDSADVVAWQKIEPYKED